MMHHIFSLRWAQDISILPHNQPVFAPWDDTISQSRLALKPVFSHFPVRDLTARDARGAAGAPCSLLHVWCSLAQGPGADHGRCCRALSKGLELQPWHWSRLHIAADASCEPQSIRDQGFLETCPCCRHWRMLALPRVREKWGLTPFHCPGRGIMPSPLPCYLPNSPKFQEPDHLNPRLLLFLPCLLQKLPMCQVYLWLLLAIWERGQEQSEREICSWEPRKRGREARFKLALGRRQCCSRSNILSKSQGNTRSTSQLSAHPQGARHRCATTSHCQTPPSFLSPPQGSPKCHASQFTSNIPLTTGDSACCWSAYLNPDTNTIFQQELHRWKAAKLCLEHVYILSKILLMFTY